MLTLQELHRAIGCAPWRRTCTWEFEWGCDVRFIRTRQVLEMIGDCRTTLWEMVRDGAFPQPVRITERTAGYLLEAVEQWMLRTRGLPWPPNGQEPRVGPTRGPKVLVARRGNVFAEPVAPVIRRPVYIPFSGKTSRPGRSERELSWWCVSR